MRSHTGGVAQMLKDNYVVISSYSIDYSIDYRLYSVQIVIVVLFQNF